MLCSVPVLGRFNLGKKCFMQKKVGRFCWVSEIYPFNKCFGALFWALRRKQWIKWGGYLHSWRLYSNEGRSKTKLKKSQSTLDVKCYEEKQDRTRKMENARFWGVGFEILNRVVREASPKRQRLRSRLSWGQAMWIAGAGVWQTKDTASRMRVWWCV